MPPKLTSEELEMNKKRGPSHISQELWFLSQTFWKILCELTNPEGKIYLWLSSTHLGYLADLKYTTSHRLKTTKLKFWSGLLQVQTLRCSGCSYSHTIHCGLTLQRRLGQNSYRQQSKRLTVNTSTWWTAVVAGSRGNYFLTQAQVGIDSIFSQVIIQKQHFIYLVRYCIGLMTWHIPYDKTWRLSCNHPEYCVAVWVSQFPPSPGFW